MPPRQFATELQGSLSVGSETQGIATDGRKLRVLFHQFNAQYFGSKLASYSIRAVERITDFGEGGFCNRRRKIIKILRSLSDEDAISCLLHEMAPSRDCWSPWHALEAGDAP
jgi:hypothetical protein